MNMMNHDLYKKLISVRYNVFSALLAKQFYFILMNPLLLLENESLSHLFHKLFTTHRVKCISLLVMQYQVKYKCTFLYIVSVCDLEDFSSVFCTVSPNTYIVLYLWYERFSFQFCICCNQYIKWAIYNCYVFRREKFNKCTLMTYHID